MTDNPERKLKFADLRRRAEEQLQSQIIGADSAFIDGQLRLLHEMEALQAELLAQNEELQASTARFAELYERAPVGYVTVDVPGSILRANLTVTTMLGIPRNEMVGHPLASFIHPEDQDLFSHHREQFLDTGEKQRCELRLKKKDGAHLWVRMEGSMAENPEGMPLALVVISDITDRRHAEAALLNSEAKLFASNQVMAGILENTHVMAVLLDARFNFIWVNRAYAVACGYEQDFFPGKNHFALYPHQENHAIFQRVVDTGEPFFVAANPFDFHDHPERGVTYWDWSLTAVKNEAGLVVNLVFTLADVTTRVRAELALHEREKAYAETLQKLNEGLEERVALRTAQLQVALVAAAQEIETRQAAEEALRKEELKFRTVVDFTYDWEVWNGVDGIPIYVSPSCERITGYSSREFLEDPGLFMRIVHPEDVSSVQARHARAVEHQDIEELEFRILTRTGELRWIGHACLPVYAADGTWLGQRSSNRDITERKRAEEAHAASEARAQAMLQTAMEGIWLVGADGRLLEVNAAACRMLGYTRSELLELSVPDIEAEESREATRAHIERVLINGSDRFASRHRRKDGTVFPVEISATFHPDTNQIVGFIRDITERVQTESKLGEQRRFLESITNALPGMVVYWTRELKCAFANSSALELFGKPLESVLGASFQTLLGERQFNEREAYIRGVLEGVPQRFEAELALPNGKVLNVWTQYIPQDRDGVILGFLVLAMDITELKQAQAALERSEKRLRLVVDTALDAVISIDQDGRVTSWNAQSESLFGWREDEARGRDIATLIIPEAHREAHRGGLARSLITGEGPMLNRRIETTAQHRDGHEFPLEISIAPVQFGGKVTYTAFARDLTERRRQESLAREMEAATAKSRMAAYLAHEINNPLAGINNSFRLIEGSFPPDHPDRRFLAIIRKELDRIAGIVRTAYSIHRPGLPQVKQASIPEILADLGVLIQSKLKDMEVRLEVEIPDPDLRGRIHEDLLRQVLFNVFQNALGACSRGGRIHCLCRTEGTHLVVVVTDNGSGIPVGVVPRIFEPGFTTKFGLETGGLGLGLSTCRTLLESVGGSIGFQHAEPGPGACFMIRLPWQS